MLCRRKRNEYEIGQARTGAALLGAMSAVGSGMEKVPLKRASTLELPLRVLTYLCICIHWSVLLCGLVSQYIFTNCYLFFYYLWVGNSELYLLWFAIVEVKIKFRLQ